MLVLTRKTAERIHIGDVVVVILHASHGRVSVGIEAPRETKVLRGEVVERDQKEQEAA
jgi:carbon storage regulator CsrA